MTSLYGYRPQATMQTVPATNVWIHVNPDEADRILVDPAYKLERLKEAQNIDSLISSLIISQIVRKIVLNRRFLR